MEQNKSFSVTSGCISAARRQFPRQLHCCMKTLASEESQGQCCTAWRKKREIKNNKAQCLEGCSTLSITAPIRAQGTELLSHSPSPIQVLALVNIKMF